MKKQIFVVGGGFFGKQCMDILIYNKIKINGFFDDFNKNSYRSNNNVGKILEIKNKCDPKNTELILGFGNSKLKQQIYSELKEYSFPNLIDNRCYITKPINLGFGNIFLPFSFIQSECNIQNFNIFDIYSIVGHGSNIGNYNHVACHVCIG